MAPFILSVRPLPDSQLDSGALARRGVPALAAPLLEPHLIAPTLPDDPSCYAGLIFTSRHAVDGFLAALGHGGPGGPLVGCGNLNLSGNFRYHHYRHVSSR